MQAHRRFQPLPVASQAAKKWKNTQLLILLILADHCPLTLTAARPTPRPDLSHPAPCEEQHRMWTASSDAATRLSTHEVVLAKTEPSTLYSAPVLEEGRKPLEHRWAGGLRPRTADQSSRSCTSCNRPASCSFSRPQA